MGKILTIQSLKTWARDARQQGIKVVLTNGCFDLLHVGHVRYLESAKKLGDALLVAVNSDASVRTLKGSQRPINSEQDRAEIIAALQAVDYVVIFDSPRATEIIQAIRPAIYAKGGDYTLDTLDPEEVTALREAGTDIRILPKVPNRSTSALIHRMGNDT